jgi:hypothetical protein
MAITGCQLQNVTAADRSARTRARWRKVLVLQGYVMTDGPSFPTWSALPGSH